MPIISPRSIIITSFFLLITQFSSIELCIWRSKERNIKQISFIAFKPFKEPKSFFSHSHFIVSFLSRLLSMDLSHGDDRWIYKNISTINQRHAYPSNSGQFHARTNSQTFLRLALSVSLFI
jgi:hypothetical protein